MVDQKEFRFAKHSCPRCKSREMIRFEEDLLTITDPSNILTIKEKLAIIRAFAESD